jgi:hypothetical protein
MNIKTRNPIIINGARESNPSEYLSADGDDFYNADGDDFYNADGDDFYNAEGDNYSYIDQKNSVDVKAFQNYALTKGADISYLTYTGKRLTGSAAANGVWHSGTQRAYAKYGAEWEALKNPPQGTPTITPTSTTAPSVEVVNTNVPQVPAGQQPTVAQLEEQKKKGIFWDKLKGTWIKAKQSGVLDWLAGLIGIKKPQGELPPVGSPQYGSNTTAGKDRKLSKNAKIAIAIGSVLVVGLIIYSIRRNRK